MNLDYRGYSVGADFGSVSFRPRAKVSPPSLRKGGFAKRTVVILDSVRISGPHHRRKPVIAKNNNIRCDWALFKAPTRNERTEVAIGWNEGPGADSGGQTVLPDCSQTK